MVTSTHAAKWLGFARAVSLTAALACRRGQDRAPPAQSAASPPTASADRSAAAHLVPGGLAQADERLWAAATQFAADADLVWSRVVPDQRMAIAGQLAKRVAGEVAAAGDAAAWREALQARWQTPESWQLQARTELALDALLGAALQAPIEPAELAKYYSKHQQLFAKPEQLRLAELAIHAESEAELVIARTALQEIERKLAKGAGFAEVAHLSAGLPGASFAANRGWTTPGDLDPRLVAAVQSKEPGQFTAIVQTSFGLHLLQVLERIPEQTLTMSQAEPQVVAHLRAERAVALRAQKLQQLRDAKRAARKAVGLGWTAEVLAALVLLVSACQAPVLNPNTLQADPADSERKFAPEATDVLAPDGQGAAREAPADAVVGADEDGVAADAQAGLAADAAAADAKVDAEPEVVADAKVDAEPEVVADAKVDAAPEVIADAKVDAAPEVVADAKVDAIPEVVADAKVDAAPEVVADAKVDAAPEVVADAKVDAAPEVVADAKVDAAPEVVADAKVDAASDATAPPQWASDPKKAVANLHLSWQHDPATAMTLSWTTEVADPKQYLPQVLYAKVADAGVEGAQLLQVGKTAAGTAVTYPAALAAGAKLKAAWHVEISGLEPDTEYVARVGTWKAIGPNAADLVGADLSLPTTFHTAPAVGSTQAMTMVFTGDSRNGLPKIQANMAYYQNIPALAWFFNGDMSPVGTQDEWNAWFTTLQPVLRRRALMPVQGNHETLADHYYAQFALPVAPGLPLNLQEHAWSLDVGNAHMVGLDANSDQVAAAQAPWLAADLQAAQANPAIEWIIVTMHQSPYSSCSNHGSTLYVQKHWVPLFEKYGVDLVFSGHDHVYERTHPIAANKVVAANQGVTYVVAGAFFAPPYVNGKAWFTAVSHPGNAGNLAILTVQGKTAAVKVWSGDGKTQLDAFGLTH